MKKLVKTNMMVGLFTILPIVILFILFQYVFSWIQRISLPIVANFKITQQIGDFFAALLGFLILLTALFILGAFVRTKVGKWFYTFLETQLLSKLPLYKAIKETLDKFRGSEGKPPVFTRVGLVDPYKTGNFMTAFITDETHDRYTVFVPTSPQPTTGYIFHVLKEDFILTPEIKLEEALKSVISVGVGSENIVNQLNHRR